MSSPAPSFRCPCCGMVSHNSNDVKHRYCGACHAFVDDPLQSTGGPFAVYQYFGDGTYEEVATKLDVQPAVERAKALVTSIGGRIGTTTRVLITDGDDYVVFEWAFGEGVLYPPPGYVT